MRGHTLISPSTGCHEGFQLCSPLPGERRPHSTSLSIGDAPPGAVSFTKDCELLSESRWCISSCLAAGSFDFMQTTRRSCASAAYSGPFLCGQSHQCRIDEASFNQGKKLHMVATLWHDFGVRNRSYERRRHLQQGSVNERREPNSQWRNGDIVTCTRSRNHVIAKCKNLPRSRGQHLSRRSQFDTLGSRTRRSTSSDSSMDLSWALRMVARQIGAWHAGNILLFGNGNQISEMRNSSRSDML